MSRRSVSQSSSALELHRNKEMPEFRTKVELNGHRPTWHLEGDDMLPLKRTIAKAFIDGRLARTNRLFYVSQRVEFRVCNHPSGRFASPTILTNFAPRSSPSLPVH